MNSEDDAKSEEIMESIIRDIKEEREYQHQQFGNHFDDKNTINDWATYIIRYAGNAAFTENKSQEEARTQFLKVATLGLAAVEAFDRNGLYPARHYEYGKSRCSCMCCLYVTPTEFTELANSGSYLHSFLGEKSEYPVGKGIIVKCNETLQSFPVIITRNDRSLLGKLNPTDLEALGYSSGKEHLDDFVARYGEVELNAVITVLGYELFNSES